MSSPEEHEHTAGDERHLTIIVVPHGELETRSFVLSYAKFKLLIVVGVILLLVFAVSLAALFPVMSQAARVRALQKELQTLEAERARVAELARTLQQVEEQYERVRQMLGADAPTGQGVPMLPPLRDTTRDTTKNDDGQAAGIINLWPLQVAGYVTRALSDGRSQHPGLDIAVPRNSYIRAAGSGTVRAAGVDEIYGRYVVIDHGEKLESVYGHASKLFVTAGDQVKRGQIIALTGSTGRSTAPHLHFEVRHNSKPVDPLTFVRQP